MTKEYIVFDIGGTFIKYAIIDENFKIILKDKFPYDNNTNDGIWLVNEICNKIIHFKNKFQNISGIGISTAGDVDDKTTQILGCVPNHRNYKGLKYSDFLSKINLPLIVENDANCAVYGEKIKGKLINNKFGILITLGTDIGGGIIIDNKIYRGYKNLSSQVGFTNVLNRRCGKYFSAKGLSILANEELDVSMSPIEILKSDNLELKKIVEYWYEGLGICISNLIALFNPEKLIIGGGLSEANILDINKIKKIIDKNLIEDHLINSYCVELSTLGNDAALIGLCQLLNEKIQKNI